eukprot:g4771.t1
MEDILNEGRPAPLHNPSVEVDDKVLYQIKMTGLREGKEQYVNVELSNSRGFTYSGNFPVSGLRRIGFDQIKLFADLPGGGWTFLYLESDTPVEFNDFELAFLPEVPNKNVTAPFVIDGTDVILSKTHIHDNYHSRKAGGIYIIGNSHVNMKQGQINNNKAEVGAVVVGNNSVVNLSEVQVYQNEGSITSGVHVTEASTFNGNTLVFYEQSKGDYASGVYSTGQSNTTLIHCIFKGQSASEDYRACLLDSSVIDVKTCGNGNEIASSVLHVDALASMRLFTTTLTKHSTQRGAILFTGQSTFFAVSSNFTDNVAHTGGGLYVQNERGSAAVLLYCHFQRNLARYGGAMVLSGNGSFLIQDSHVEQNRAIIGGAVWGNTSYDLGNTTAAGEKASSVSRLTIANSDFINNSAIAEGGALSVKRTYVHASSANFHNNVAGGSGGAIYTDNAYNLNFLDCEFSSNFANANGGAIFAVNAYDIYATNCYFSNHSATSNGGTIASIDGHGIAVRNTTITSSHAYSNGGAIFTDNVTLLNTVDSVITGNVAGKSGGALSLGSLSGCLLASVDLSGNEASGNGSAVYLLKGSYVEMSDLNISNTDSSSSIINLSSSGIVTLSGFNFEGIKDKSVCGGLNIDGASSLTISDMKFVDNEVRGHGGALCLQNISYGNLRNLEFSNNFAGMEGGAVYIAQSNRVNFTNVEFKVNSATYQGGAIKGVNVGALILDETVFSSNIAQWKGGAICLEKSSISIQKSMFSHNYAGSNDAAFTKRTSVVTRAQNFPSSGVVYVEDGSKFYSQNSTYEFNKADAYGGTLTLNNVTEALIQGDTYLNGSAAVSGGCILANSVKSFQILGTRLQYCEAASGGAVMIEGKSNIKGGSLFFDENSANNGGAILCKGSSEVDIKTTNFSFNSAKDGSTASIDCYCDMNFSNSTFYRDNDLDNNGKFFHTIDGCGHIKSDEGCEFFQVNTSTVPASPTSTIKASSTEPTHEGSASETIKANTSTTHAEKTSTVPASPTSTIKAGSPEPIHEGSSSEIIKANTSTTYAEKTKTVPASPTSAIKVGSPRPIHKGSASETIKANTSTTHAGKTKTLQSHKASTTHKDKKNSKSFPWIYVVIAGACLVFIMVILVIFILWKRASKRNQTTLESRGVEDPLVSGQGKA